MIQVNEKKPNFYGNNAYHRVAPLVPDASPRPPFRPLRLLEVLLYTCTSRYDL